MVNWQDIAAIATLIGLPVAGIAAWFASQQLRTERAQHFPTPEIRRYGPHHVRVSVPEDGEFKIAQISIGWRFGTIAEVTNAGTDSETGVSLFHASGMPTRTVRVEPPASEVWLRTDISGSKPTLDIKITSDRFKSLTVPKTLWSDIAT